ncbi:hypothetical protein [Clostridium sp. C2-6-12]|uniref:hypothetical protein n=1 Tax=Clostridium sp. C2-6-12 TaxID=2698832 RepID=UPI00136A0DD2|nr:hypothetical protein [Clostridium sp. C2-6-12]
MSHRKSNRSHKKNKAKNQRDTKSRQDIYETEEEYVKKVGGDIYGENIMQGGLGINTGDVNSKKKSNGNSSDGENKTNSNQANVNNTEDTNANTNNAENDNGINNTNVTNSGGTSNDINNLCEEIKARQQELLDRLKNLSDALASLALIRDNYNSIQVDTFTELYFTRQVRPLLDALNIISFASTNMSATATAFQTSAFTDTKEIKNALKLSYKMNDEVDDIINNLGRRLTIFLKLIDNMDRNCPPFRK